MKSEQSCIWTGVALGALGGCVGAFVMNEFQSLWSIAQKALAEPKKLKEASQSDRSEAQPQKSESGDDATVKTASFISENVLGRPLTQDQKEWAGPAVHYVYGTLMGALYGGLGELLPAVQAGRGTAFAAALWLGGDEIAVPALGLSSPSAESPLSSHVSTLAAHLIYGFVTDLVKRAA